MPSVKMSLGTLGGVVQTQYSGNVQAGADNLVTVDVRDAPSLLALGASYVNQRTSWQSVPGTPAAGAAGTVVASTGLSNGTLTIAAQPAPARVLSVRAWPGTTGISAGTATLVYTGNDGVLTTDSFSLITPTTTALAQNTSKAVTHLNSAIVTGVAGGASPGVQIDDTNALGIFVDPGFSDFQVLQLQVDGGVAGGTTNSSAAAITPSTAPNGTHTYSALVSYNFAVA